MDATEKINGLIALISVRPKYNRTQFPYNQMVHSISVVKDAVVKSASNSVSGGHTASIVFYG